MLRYKLRWPLTKANVFSRLKTVLLSAAVSSYHGYNPQRGFITVGYCTYSDEMNTIEVIINLTLLIN